MMLEWLGLGVGSFTQNVAPAGPENTGKSAYLPRTTSQDAIW